MARSTCLRAATAEAISSEVHRDKNHFARRAILEGPPLATHAVLLFLRTAPFQICFPGCLPRRLHLKLPRHNFAFERVSETKLRSRRRAIRQKHSGVRFWRSHVVMNDVTLTVEVDGFELACLHVDVQKVAMFAVIIRWPLAGRRVAVSREDMVCEFQSECVRPGGGSATIALSRRAPVSFEERERLKRI
jgi:hypothetical protein